MVPGSRTAAAVVSQLNRYRCEDRTRDRNKSRAGRDKVGRVKLRIARVNRRAARQRQMRERWSTIILQRTKQRIGVDLIARASQKAAAVIAADVIAVRGDGAAVVEDVFSECAGVEDRVRNISIVTDSGEVPE